MRPAGDSPQNSVVRLQIREFVWRRDWFGDQKAMALGILLPLSSKVLSSDLLSFAFTLLGLLSRTVDK